MIHPTAIIDNKADIADDVDIGPYSIIGPHVTIDEGTLVGPHVVINGHTKIGKHNRFFQFSSIGEENQDKKYKGEPTKTVIGDYNIFRESCTVHRGTTQDIGYTQIGHHGLFMAYVHIAHDCIVGDHVIFANNATIAGHVTVGDWAILGGFSGVHQFCKIGAHAFLGIRTNLTKDVPPYVMLHNDEPRAINTEGLKRRGFTAEDISLIKSAFRELYRKDLSLNEAKAAIQEIAEKNEAVHLFLDFLNESERGLVR